MARPRGDDALADNPFDWQVTGDERVLISRDGRQIVVVAGAAGRRLVARLASADASGAPQLLARATGHYKHT